MTENKKSIAAAKHWLRTGKTLTDALPYLQKFNERIFVIKYGGAAMGDDQLARDFANDVVLLKHCGIHPIVVHGGGPQIGRMLDRLKIQSSFVDGLRVTDQETVDIVEMVLSGNINKRVVSSINAAGGVGVGLSGKDGSLIKARKLRRTKRDPDSNIEKILDLGFVGEPTGVDPGILFEFIESGIVPVIAPIGIGENGETFNINADTAAGAVAAAVEATRLFLLTDVPGVLDKEGHLVEEMTLAEAEAAIHDGTITGGMIPKIETCIRAVRDKVDAAVVLDGRMPHSLLLDIFTPHGIGTMIREGGG
ncbi:MAG: acetylglutamate kinase [Alphaproteobacteria bacterium]|nr:acetylglutamate kinase [Alphaproteobacteria bacterium]